MKKDSVISPDFIGDNPEEIEEGTINPLEKDSANKLQEKIDELKKMWGKDE